MTASQTTGQIWLTLEQLCDRLQVPESTVRWWRNTRTGPPAVRVGRWLRYRLTDVEKWEASLEAATEPEARHSRRLATGA